MPPVDGPQNTRKKQLKKERVVKAPRGDVVSGGGYGLKTAKKHKRTPEYRQASQEAYSGAPTARKRKILKNAKGTEGVEARRVHAKRVKRNREIERGQAGSDSKGDRDLLRGAAERDRNVAEARIKYLRRSRKPVVSLRKELEGEGLLAGGLNEVADFVERRLSAGGDTSLPGYKATQGTTTTDPAKLGPRFAKDLINLPAQAIPSLYVPVAGTVEAAKGRPQRIKKLAADIDASDPVFNLGAAAVEAIGGDSKSAKRRLKAAGEAASEHPGYAGAELLGAKGVVGRGTGRAMRSGVAGKKIKKVAATTRPPLVLEGTGIEVPRSYSPDVITKGRQKLEESGSGPSMLRHDKIRPQDVKRRVDERVSVTGTDPAPFLEEFGARSPSGKVKLHTTGQVEKAKADLEARTGFEFVAQHADGTRARHVLVPRVALDRLMEHADAKPKTTAGKAISVTNDQFRRTVLSTSTAWAFGNVAEASVRGALAKAGPRSWMTERKVRHALADIDPAKAVELADRVAKGGHYSLAERTHLKDVASEFGGTALEPLANALHKTITTPGPKHVAKAWRLWTDTVFAGTRRVEQQFQRAMAGAEIRRTLMDGNTLKMSEKAIEQAAEGLRNTTEQVRLARATREMYGQYDAFSPGAKMIIAHYTPFVAWLLNATRFVTRTLPRDHPAAVGLTAAMENATEEWRKDHGLDLFLEGGAPGWLQGSIPTPSGGKIRASRFTPMGAFADLPGTVGGSVLPVIAGPLLATKGLDWAGRPLPHARKGSEGERQARNLLVAAGEFVDSTIPVIAQAKRVKDKGVEAFNPLTEVKPYKKKIRKRKTTSSTPKWNDGSSGGRFKFDSGAEVKWDDGG